MKDHGPEGSNPGRVCALVACIMAPLDLASAHEVGTAATRGGSELAVAVAVLILVALYVVGLLRLMRTSRARRELARRACLFAVGCVALTLALLSPIDDLGARSFGVHMVQHEILMLVAAPALVMGRPLAVMLWALALPARRTIGAWTRIVPIASAWRFLSAPLAGWALHAIALWVWHAPRFFNAALSSQAWHDAQHLSFLVTALLFWFALLEARAREATGAAVLFLFTTTVHTGVLGALITFAPKPLYELPGPAVESLGLTPLEDQQLGGLIMWVPGALVYVGFGLALLLRWINGSAAGTRVHVP